MEKKDYYNILGVDRNASQDEIKKAFRKISLKYHPDRLSNKSDKEKKKGEEKFKAAAEAYSILSDEEKKRQYDTFGTVDGSSFNFNGSDINDIINHFAHRSGFHDFFSDMNMQTEPTYRGQDKELKININVEELYKGGNKTIKYKINKKCPDCSGKGSKNGKEIKCPYCHGSGQIIHTERRGYAVMQQITTCPHCNGTGVNLTDSCPHCHGSGVIETEETMEILIPKIDQFNKRYVKRGMGNACFRNKGENGDLYFSFRLDNSGKYKIDVDNPINIITEIEIPVINCITGGEIKFKYIDGQDILFKITQCTNNGDKYVIKGKGLKTTFGQTGDLIIIVKAKMPNKISKEETKLLDKLKNMVNFK